MPLKLRATNIIMAAFVALGSAALLVALPSLAKVSGDKKSKAAQSKVVANGKKKAARSEAAGDSKSKSAQSKSVGDNKKEAGQSNVTDERDGKASKSEPAAADNAKDGAKGAEDAKTATPVAKSEPDFPKVVPTKDGKAEAEAKPDVWSEEEIAQAKAHCDKVLNGVEAVLEPAEPIKQGECGAPAPVRLISIGRSPEVTLSPPVTVTCDMVAKLANWVKEDLQDLAKTHLGAPVVRMSTMSSYSCRNAYGRKKTRLSEHGRANAVDVGSFTTSSGTQVDLLTGWGLTARDVQAIIAAAKAAAEKAAAEKAAHDKAGRKPGKAKTAGAELAKTSDRSEGNAKSSIVAKASAASAPDLPLRKAVVIAMAEAERAKGVKTAESAKTAKSAKSSIVARPSAPDLPVRKAVVIAMEAERAKVDRSKSVVRKTRGKRGSEVLAVASHLGGPDVDLASIAALDGKPLDSRSQFLRAAHSSACRRFGTVLGPEANDAHRNHFHLDMAERKRSNYCE